MSEVAIYSTFDIRLRAVEAVERGVPRVHVASAYGIDRSTLCRWIENYQRECVLGLYRNEGSGRPKLLNELTEKELRTIVLSSALSYGFESDLWTVGRLHQMITERFQVFVSKHTIWRRLVDAGLTYQNRNENTTRQTKTFVNIGGVMKYRKSSVVSLKIRQFYIFKTRRMFL